MFKYTLKDHWKHYYRQLWKNGPHYVGFENRKLFSDAGWPQDYSSWWVASKAAYNLEFYSKNKLKLVPCAGYLIPVNFFDEKESK